MTFDISEVLKNSNKASKTESVPHGKYSCRCDEVIWAPGYKPGSAFKMTYTLTNSAGEEFSLKEIFYNSNTARTCEFFEYLIENGFQDVFDFEGSTEEVEIGYSVSGYKRFNGIISRSFVAPKEDENQ